MTTTKPAYTRFEAEHEVRYHLVDWVGHDSDHPMYQSAVLLLLGIGRRKHLGDLVNVSKYSRPFVKKCMANLRQSGVWKTEDKTTWGDWDHPVGFIMDVMVAVGMAKYKYCRDTMPL